MFVSYNAPAKMFFFPFNFRVPGDALDVAASEVNDSDLPPAECEEENNPYDSDR